MTASLTEKEFSQHLNTNFELKLNDQAVDLKLVEVKGYMSEENEQTGMERFSVFFDGPPQPFLPQATYPLQHDLMGQFEIFLVPIGKNGEAVRYEAVFNYYK